MEVWTYYRAEPAILLPKEITKDRNSRFIIKNCYCVLKYKNSVPSFLGAILI